MLKIIKKLCLIIASIFCILFVIGFLFALLVPICPFCEDEQSCLYRKENAN